MKLTILSRHTVYALFSVFLIIPRSFAEQPDAILSGNNNLIPVATPSYTKPTLTENIIIPGDVNGDGKVTEADAELVLQFAAGILTPTEAQIQAADLKGDGQITSADAIKIQRIVSGLDLLPSAVVIPVPSVTLDNAPAVVSTDTLEITPTAADPLASQPQESSEVVTPETSYYPDSQQMQEPAALSTNPIGLLLDVNGDGEVDNRDRDAILQYSIGSIVEKTEDTTKNLFNNVTRYSVTQDSAGYSAGIVTNKPILSGEANFDKAKADTNGDGKINAQDAIVFLNLETKTSDQALQEGWLPKVNSELGLDLITQASEQAAIPNIKESAGVKNQAGEDTLGAIVDTANKQGISILDKVASANVAAELVIYTPVEPIVEAIDIASQGRVDQIVTDHPEAVNIQTNNDATAKKTIALWNNASQKTTNQSINGPTNSETLIAVLSNNNLSETAVVTNAWLEELRDYKKRDKALNYYITLGLPAVNPLINILVVCDNQVSQAVKSTLVKMGDSIVPLLSGAVNNSNLPVRIRSDIVVVLGKIGSPGVIPVLINIIKQKNSLSEVAISALGGIGKPAVPSLLELLSNTTDIKVLKKIVDVLGKIGDVRAVPLLTLLLSDNDASVRVNAAVSLGLIKDPASVLPLIELLDDPEKDVRDAVVTALGRIGNSAIEPLIKVIIEATDGSGEDKADISQDDASPMSRIWMKQLAIEVLTTIGVPAIKPLLDNLINNSISTRQAILETLLWIGDSKVRVYLEEEINGEKDLANQEYLQQLLTDLDGREQARAEIEIKFNIKVGDSTPLNTIKMISNVLSSLPKDLISGLEAINSENVSRFIGCYPLDDWRGKIITINPNTCSSSELLHEIGHFVDQNKADAAAFRALGDEGNVVEEFAILFADYVYNGTAEEFIKAIEIAKSGQGDSVQKMLLFERCLFFLDLLADKIEDGKPTGEVSMIFVKAGDDDGPIIAKKLSLDRDSQGKIYRIGNVNLYSYNSSNNTYEYNLLGLEDLFYSLIY